MADVLIPAVVLGVAIPLMLYWYYLVNKLSDKQKRDYFNSWSNF